MERGDYAAARAMRVARISRVDGMGDDLVGSIGNYNDNGQCW